MAVKVLIVGSEGFIGRHLVREFSRGLYKVFGSDLCQHPSQSYVYLKSSGTAQQFDAIFKTCRFDLCINAAGCASVTASLHSPLTDFEANTRATMYLLEAIRCYNPQCRYLHISSAAVYGNPRQLPVKEEAVAQPLSCYGWHKFMGEQICTEYATVFGASVCIVRPFSVYGAGLKKQLLWDVSMKLKHTDSMELFGTGNESRDFMHVADFCRLVALLVKNDCFDGSVFNAGNGIETSIRQVAAIFVNFHQRQKKIFFSGVTRCGDPANWKADTGKIAALGYQPTIDFKKGCLSYIHWFNSLNG